MCIRDRDKAELTLVEGETGMLKAGVLPEDATEKTVAWESSDPAVASVDENGTITAVKEGQVVITAKAGGASAQCLSLIHIWHTDATCDTGGTTTYKCTRCGETKQDSTNAQGHNYVEKARTGFPCTGYKVTKACTRCGDVVTTDEPATQGHDRSGDMKTENGKTLYQCSMCGGWFE